MKYYVVKKGYKTGIFDNWEQCKTNVYGFSGAEYKSFNNQNDAYDYLNNKTEYINNEINTDSDTAIAYCNGNYDDNTQRFSYGAIIINNNQTVEFSQAFDAFDTGRNITGEIFGAMKAMRYCLENNIEALDLYYDYTEIEAWATGKWTPTTQLTKTYANFCKELKDKLNVNFIKVQTHKDVKLNKKAGKIAKAALGL